ncbi:MAG: VWA domain-containing protein [Treponema sp.]|nr:VWA domain-containing protein [Treponema sp.]
MNGSFSFTYPWVLYALAVFVPLVLFDIFGSQRKREQRLPEELRKKLIISVLFFRVFIACVIIALAQPRWGISFSQTENRRSLDTVFAIDVSRSMDIRDAGSRGLSRLERGLAIARETAAAVPGPRYAAAIGKGTGILAVPLTWDSEAALSFLESLESSSITGRGTNLESLLTAAAGAFHGTFPARQVIVLISDGESLSGVIRAALDRCAGSGVIVVAVAVGSDEGRPVPGDGISDDEGTISSRDAAVMRMAARRTGGIYIDGNRDDAAGILAAHLRSLSPESGFQGSRPEPKERRSLFIILAIIAYGMSKFSPLAPGKKR